MQRFVLFFALAAQPFICQAQKGQSIMFGDPDPIYTERKKDTSADELADECQQLRREMDALKGKPQRRHAVVERYKRECTRQEPTPGQPLLQ